mgnify:FL=1
MIDRLETRLEAAREQKAPAVTERGAAAATTSSTTAQETPAAEIQSVRGDESAAVAGEEETNVWPSEAEEAAFLAEASERGEKVVPVSREVEEEADDAKPLPKLDELVNRIPAETRELLDELFRARFVAVRKVKKKDLKVGNSAG